MTRQMFLNDQSCVACVIHPSIHPLWMTAWTRHHCSEQWVRSCCHPYTLDDRRCSTDIPPVIIKRNDLQAECSCVSWACVWKHACLGCEDNVQVCTCIQSLPSSVHNRPQEKISSQTWGAVIGNSLSNTGFHELLLAESATVVVLPYKPLLYTNTIHV